MSTMQAGTTAPESEVIVEHNVRVPMRDGTLLAADVFRPSAPGRYPAIVERTAYGLTPAILASGSYFPRHGYVYMVQQVRGRFASEGEFYPFRDDGWGKNRDGYDTIEWAAAQPWSNGDVGMAGGSYSGYTQYATAPTRPPHLRTLLVRAGESDFYRGAFYRGGAYCLHLLREITLRMLALPPLEHESAPPESVPLRDRLQAAYADLERWEWHLPVRSFPPLEEVAGFGWYFDWIAHPEDGPYWREIDASRMVGEADVPALHVAGWYDYAALDSTLRCFTGMRERGRTEACRAGQRLVIGPWIHGPAAIGVRTVGEIDFGAEAELDWDAFRLAWYDRRLKGAAGPPEDAPVRLFLMGANRWLNLPDWPPPNVTYQPIYLRTGGGPSQESVNNGGLTFAAPDAGEPPDAFTYDPSNPVPSLIGYPTTGPRDHRSVEGQMLTYTMDVFERDLTIVGPVKAVLYAASSAPDTDSVVRLCDVWPDGRSMSVCDGILRARYRNSFEREELMTPGEVYRFEIDLWATAQVFQAGHRLRVEVTSSDFPRYDRNLNAGGVCADETAGEVAVNRVFHDAQRASHVILPLFEPA